MTVVSTVPLVGEVPTDRLKNGHSYNVAQTFIDSNGKETSASGSIWYEIIPATSNWQLAVRSVTPPVGAVGSVLYYIDYADCNYGMGGWYFPDPTLVNHMWVWNRVVINHMPAPGEIFVINHYTPAPATAETRPPMGHNYSVSLMGFKAAGIDSGIFLDNVDGFTIERVKIKDFGLDGITLGSPEFGWIWAPGDHTVRNTVIRDATIDGALRESIGITGSVDGALFERVETMHAPWTMDIEVDVSTAGITGNILWKDCVFHGGTDGAPVILAIFEAHPAPNLLFEGFLFDRVPIIHSGAGKTDLVVSDSVFRDTYGTAVASRGADANFLFAGVSFERCGKMHPPEPDNFTGDGASGIMVLSSNGETNVHHCHATIINSSVVQLDEDPTQYLIYVMDKIENNPIARAKLMLINTKLTIGNYKARLLIGGTDYVINDVDKDKYEIAPTP